MLRKLLIAACALFAFSGLYLLTAAEPSGGAQRSVAEKLFKEGNWRDAHAIYSKLALDENASGASLASDFENGVTCLRNLQQQQQEDTFREAVIAAHPQDWQLLSKGADTLQNGVHYGFIVAGKFQRGNQRGGGAWAMSMEWDRVRALQLMQQAMGAIEKGDASASEKGQFYSRFAGLILSNRSGSEAWQLQDLTDLSQLPEIEANEGYGWRGRGGWGGGGGSKGAPVDAEGNPVYHTIPANWEAATTDGQRWRFCLEQMARHDTSLRDSADWTFAQFQMQQFGVQSMRQWGITLPSGSSENVDGDKDESGPYALSTLKETETIARLANGVKRFSIPDEYNHIAILKQLGARNGSFSDNALQTLASIFENRQQYVRAAEYWRESIQRFKDPNKNKDNRLQQIVGNWGTIENGSTQAAQGGASLDYRFRNGKQVTLTAHKLKVSELVNDVKAYIKSAPKQLDWNRLQLDNIGYLVVNQNQAKYVGEKVAEWKVDLTPRDAHYDRRLTIAVPLQQAGAYLVEAKMANGNATRVVMWIADTAIAKKQLNGKVLYYVADAVSGKPIEKANVEFFGWKNEHIPNTKNEYRIVTANFAEFSDADGMVLPDTKQLDQQMQWVVVARTGKEGEPGARFAHLGFNGIWYGNRQEQTFDQSKVIVLTDRPVYRPDQKVQFKFWVREARYDGKEGSQFANKTFTLKINDPMGTEVFKQQVTTDEFGGFAGEYPLLVDAKLGVYQIYIEHAHGVGGGSSFRVEEYKKPEFQVLIDAPTDPVKLGDKVTATIRAKYYFGAPVSKGTVKFKVVRSAHEARWYPAMPWDWMYGEGYWWFSPDYSWYRGYGKWGCMAPRPFWHHWNPEPPELVLDQEVEIGEDGTVQVEIDTALARALHGDQDHSYSITAEVVDASRRTIVGSGSVLVARQPFKVFSWTDRGHYRVGDTIVANFQARTLDGKGVEGAGQLRLLRITYNEKGEPVENVAQEWVLPTNGEGYAKQELKASEPGQYRLSYNVTSGEGDKAKTIEGGYLFVVRGDGFDGSEFQFNDLELITDKTSYKPGEKVELLINTNRVGSTVLLFLRPSHGVYEGKPQVLRLTGKSTTVDVGVVQKDMPNFFIEAVTIAGAKVHTIVREVIVPPEERILNLELTSDSESYLPGAKAKVQVKVTDAQGEPYQGSLVLSVYDKAVEYISGGSNVPEIKAHFWKWRRHHNPNTEHSLNRWFHHIGRQAEQWMQNLGAFGDLVADLDGKMEADKIGLAEERKSRSLMSNRGGMNGAPMSAAMQSKGMAMDAAAEMSDGIALATAAPGGGEGGGAGGGDLVEPTVRQNFADTAYWNATLSTNKNGVAKVTFDMPENLSAWKVRAWGMGQGTRVGEASREVVTSKNLLVRLQAPRFFVEKDEVVLSAVVHNYLKTKKQATVTLKLEGETLSAMDAQTVTQIVDIPAGGEARVDWRCKAIAEGTATVTMSALTDEESDAMQMKFPVYVHGFLKTESFSGVIRANESKGLIEFNVPADRREEQTRFELRYSPTLAGSMVDALPYLVEYPYGCTEQTLNRFLPTVITQRILQKMNIDLKEVRKKRTNLNAQEIGDDAERAKQWKRWDRNPVFSESEVEKMVKQGVQDLTAMQLSDGGWGWFSGFGEHSYPHTTAVVVHGLQVATQNDIALVPGTLERGVSWLKRYQAEQVEKLQEWERRQDMTPEQLRNRKQPYKSQADDLDGLVFMVLTDASVENKEMSRFLYRDRVKLSLYAQAMCGLAWHKLNDVEKRDMVITNIDQFLKVDPENQTAFIDLPNNAGSWWYWHGNTIEANAFYLKLMTKVAFTEGQPPRKGMADKCAGLVKYLLNNRKHSTYWNSTRDTAYCIEAMADYLKASGEGTPNLLVEVHLDGKLQQSVEITPDVLFTFDNSFVIEGKALTSGPHRLEVKTRALKEGGNSGPLYHNAYLTNFSTEDFITAAGLEIKVGRKFYKLVQNKEATDVVQGANGQVIDQKALKYDRIELPNLSEVTSGDLIEVELEIDSKNDYEYVIFEDLKAAGCEAVDLQSGYTKGGLGAYVEFRDERVAFFMRSLVRGKHSVSYRLRAETPGQFSALPTRAYAMYAPELKANSDEMKLRIADRE